jgi:hypothetical protein
MLVTYKIPGVCYGRTSLYSWICWRTPSPVHREASETIKDVDDWPGYDEEIQSIFGIVVNPLEPSSKLDVEETDGDLYAP